MYSIRLVTILCAAALGLAAVSQAANFPPTANPDSYTLNEDVRLFVPRTAGVLTNDTDVEGSSLTALLVTAPTNGTLFFTNNGGFAYFPSTNFFGVDSFTYRARDGSSNSAPAKVTLTVNPVNDAPRATNDSFTLNSDTTFVTNASGVLGNDFDVEGSTLSVVLVSNVTRGVLLLSADGSFSYIPSAGFHGTDTFRYRAHDGTTNSGIVNVTLNVVPAPLVVTQPPANQTVCVGANTSLSVSATGTALTYQWQKGTNNLQGQTNSTLFLNNVSVADAGQYRVRITGATNSVTNVATLTVNVPISSPALDNYVRMSGSIAIFDATATGTGPITYTWLRDGQVIPGQTGATLVLTNVLTTDSASYSVIVGGACGSITNTGSLVVAPCFNSFDVMLVLDRSGSMVGQPYIDARTAASNFVHNLHLSDVTNDTLGLVSYNPTATLNMRLTNSPLAVEQAIQNLGPATNGTCISCGIVAAQAELSSDRRRTDALPVMVLLTDGIPHDFDTPSNALYNAQLAKNAGTRIFTVGFGTNVDTALMRGMASQPGDYFYASNSSQLAALFDAISTVICRPPTNIFGPYDVTVCTGEQVELTVNVSGCADFTYQWFKDGVALPGQTRTNLALGSAVVTNTGIYSVVVSSVCRTVTNSAVVTVNTPAEFVSPLANQVSYRGSNVLFSPNVLGTSLSYEWYFNGSLIGTGNTLSLSGLTTNNAGTFCLVARSADCGGAVTNCVTLVVSNRPPVASADSFTILEDTRLNIGAPGLLANDSDEDGDALSAILVSGASNGSLEFQPDGSFIYTPSLNFTGVVSFTYRAFDGENFSEVTTVTVNVTPVNDRPVAVDDAYTVLEDAVLNIPAAGVLGNDSDIDGDALSVSILSSVGQGSLTLNPDGGFQFTPSLNQTGTVSFTYVAGDGLTSSAPATVIITILALNDVPLANDDAYQVTEDAQLTIPAAGILGNDSDVDGDLLTAVLVDNVSRGTLSLDANGAFVFTPSLNQTGSVSFTYRATDGTATSELATVTIQIVPVNDAPVAVVDEFTTTEDVALIVPVGGVLTNDFDVDGDALTAVLVSAPTHGQLVLNADGSFTYQPGTNFHGEDFFAYRAFDSSLHSETTLVRIVVTSSNDRPVALNDSYTTAEDTTLVLNAPGVLANDSDEDSDVLSVQLVSNVAHGQLTLNLDGSFSYTPDSNYHGQDSFSYVATDGSLTSTVATVSITVTSVNDRPLAGTPETYTVLEDQVLVTAAPGILANDSDVDGDSLSVVLVSTVSHGTLSLSPNGAFTYEPEANFFGNDSFSYVVTDGITNSPEVIVSVAVTPVNDAPSFTAGGSPRVNFNSDAQVITGWATAISAGPANESGQSLQFIVSNDNASLFAVQPAVSANGTLTFTPSGNSVGVATVNVSLRDNGGTSNGGVDTSATSTFSISLNGPPAVTIITPTNNATYVGTNTITVVADATDADGSVTNVIIYSGTNVLSQGNTTPYFGSIPDAPLGTYTFRAVAVDDLGLRATSSIVAVVVTQSPPVTALGPIVLNLQNGLFEQFVRISNSTPKSFPNGMRLLITRLDTTNQVYNATGKTNGVPYIDVHQPLPSMGVLDVLVQYYVPNPRTVPNPLLIAQPLPFVEPIAPAPLLNCVAGGSAMSLDFNTTAGRFYYLQASDDFVKWNAVSGLIRGTGTPCVMTNQFTSGKRFFRVLLLP